ncbi:hypothetical protein E4T43_02932, partial [Aureobasidium subglaciale]
TWHVCLSVCKRRAFRPLSALFPTETTKTNNHQHDSNTGRINSRRHKSIPTDITITSFSGGILGNNLGAEVGTKSISLRSLYASLKKVVKQEALSKRYPKSSFPLTPSRTKPLLPSKKKALVLLQAKQQARNKKMPPTASRVSNQFEPTPATGIGEMVICIHCQSQKLPKNSLQRKEEHLRICPSFSLSPIANERDANGRTMLEDSIARRAGRTKPGNLRAARGTGGVDGRELLRLQRLGAALAYGSAGDVQEGIQERVERILRGEGRRNDEVGDGAYQQQQQQQDSPDLDDFQTFDTPAPFTDRGGARENETMAALLESATRNTTAVPSSNNARKRTLPTDIHDSPSISQHLSNPNNNNNNTPHSMTVGQNKKLKHAELYLDEDDFDFISSAQTAREERFAALVERLARLVRLRDMRN